MLASIICIIVWMLITDRLRISFSTVSGAMSLMVETLRATSRKMSREPNRLSARFLAAGLRAVSGPGVPTAFMKGRKCRDTSDQALGSDIARCRARVKAGARASVVWRISLRLSLKASASLSVPRPPSFTVNQSKKSVMATSLAGVPRQNGAQTDHPVKPPGESQSQSKTACCSVGLQQAGTVEGRGCGRSAGRAQ